MENSKKVILVIVILIVLAMITALCARRILTYKFEENEDIIIDVNEESYSKTIENAEYEEITVYKEDGTEVNLADFKDKPAVLLFWNKDNEDSVTELKKVNSLYKKYASQINFFMINVAEDVDEEIKNDISMEIYYDFYKSASRVYKIEEFPSIIYITEKNEVFNAKAGLITTDSLEANLDILINNI